MRTSWPCDASFVGDRPIIASMKAGSFGSSDTYIVVTGIDEHGELAVVDPLSRDRTSRHWTFDEIISQATASGPTRRPRKVRRSPRHSARPMGALFFYGKHALHCWRRGLYLMES